jgi:predicted transcriptional regulator
LIDTKMSTGLYASQDQLLRKALQALDDYEESVADIRAGMEDEAAGRTLSIAEADREIRQTLGFSP